MIVIVCIVLAVIGSAYGQFPLTANETCDTFCHSPYNSLNPNEFNGIWFFTQSLPLGIFNDSKCMVLNVTNVNSTFSTFEVYERFMSQNSERLTDGTMTFASNGTLFIEYTELKLPFTMHVVYKSANSFALVKCLTCGFYEEEGAGLYAYLFTRIPYPSCDTYTPSYDAIEVCGIPRDALYPVDHSSCEATC